MTGKPKHPHPQPNDEQLKATREWITQKVSKVLSHAAKVIGVDGEAPSDRRIRSKLYDHAARFCAGMARDIKGDK